MASRLLEAVSYANWGKGNYQSIAEAIAPPDSVKLALNCNSDDTFGEMVSRYGQTIITGQIIDNKPVLGLHNFKDTVGTTDKLFAVLSDGTNNDIYDVVTGAKSLEDDTKDLKTRFLTYLDSCLRLNGTDGAKAWNGSAWVTTAGAFDLSNVPTGSKYAIEFKDRVYVAGSSTNPDRVDISGIANSTTRTISWTVGNKFVIFEQEDGGGGITGLWKVPGYVLVGKKRTLKRYDGSSAYPEDMVNQGVPSQEAGIVSAGIFFFANENGAWATQGGAPKKISSFTVDTILKSCSAANLLNVASGTDEEHVFWSFASVTIGGEVYTNVVLKYNILNNTWDIRQYPTLPRVFSKYIDSNGAMFLVCGDNDGNVLKMDTGNTDNGTPITVTHETHNLSFGNRMFLKSISRMGVITENISNGALYWKGGTNNPDHWEALATINNEVTDVASIDIRAFSYAFKIVAQTTTGKVRIKSFEFPEGIKVFDVSQ